MFLQAPSLASLDGIRHAFFTRHGGVSEGIYASLNGGVGSSDDAERVRENRARMAAAVGVTPDHLLTAYQIHSPTVAIADRPWSAEDRPRADALVTKTPKLAIGVSTADCGPVLFADPQARVIGAAHSGWRGAIGGVLEATLAKMEELGAARQNIRVALGPMISQKNYEVGPEFVQQFHAQEAASERFFAPAAREGHAMFDLAGYVAWRLGRAGIAAIEDLARCNYAEPDMFYSFRRTTHRRESDYGRHVNAIALGD